MGAIFYLSQQSFLSQQPQPGDPSGGYAASIVAHLGLFAVLGFLLYWALSGVARSREVAWVVGGAAFAVAVLYGVTDELHQTFVPGRVASEADLVLDAMGALLGVVSASALLRHQRGNRTPKISRPNP
ncbi:MAG: VanZ family protein [Chloroflexi bacterium]|nr:VanZ family protein [Chloroflexota bacterium]